MKTIPNLAVVLLSGFLAVSLIAEPSFAADAASVQGQCKTLVYSANPSYPPYHWAVGTSRFEGASIELLKLLTPPGVRLQPVVYPWKRVLELARQGEIGLIVSLRETPARAEFLTFTRHRSFPNPIVVFMSKAHLSPFNSWADLKGLQGGISAGDTFGGGFDEYWRRELSIQEIGTMESNFQKLAAGRIDYFVTSKYVGQAYAASNPQAGGIIPVGKAVSEQDIRFGFSKASPCAALAEGMSRRLDELDRDGTLERLLDNQLRMIRDGQRRSAVSRGRGLMVQGGDAVALEGVPPGGD